MFVLKQANLFAEKDVAAVDGYVDDAAAIVYDAVEF